MHVIFRQTKTSSNPMRKSDTSYAVINKQVRGQPSESRKNLLHSSVTFSEALKVG